MNVKQRKSKILYLLLSMTLIITALSSCMVDQNLQSEEEETKANEKQVTFRMNLSSEANKQPEGSKLSSLIAYHFLNGVLQKIDRNISVADNNFALYVAGGYTVYFLVNQSETEELKALVNGVSTESSFLTLRSVATEDQNPPQFFSGSYQFPSELTNLSLANLNMYRNLACLDLDTSRDTQINVSRIVITDASANSTLFPGKQLSAPSTQKVTYNKVYDPAITSTEGIQYLYESSTPVKVTVYATLHGMPNIVELSIPQIKRNFRYNVKLVGVGSNITGQLQIVPWETGDNATASPDEAGKIYLNSTYSTLTDGVVIDEQKESVSISEKGGEFVLAFTSDIAVSTDQIEGEGGNITITPEKVETKDGKVISFFRMNVKPQSKGKLPYQAILHMKRPMQQFSYDRFTIDVSGSQYQIMEATIGGVTWMAFNATTANLEDQIYILDGISVEETYQRYWGSTIGGLFQWGRPYKYTPWLVGVSNAGGLAKNSPWTSRTHVPCPPGYRIPTNAEMKALLPLGTTFPGTYTYNGEKIKVELNTSQPSNVNIGGVTGTARYLSFTSETTGEVLYIPLAGAKGDKSGSRDPGFGQGFVLWTSEAIRVSYVHSGRFWPGNGTSYTIGSNNTETGGLADDSYSSVRCLKMK